MLYATELETLSEPALLRLKEAVAKTVVVVWHPMFGGGYDVWYRDDFERLRHQNPFMTAHFKVEAATLDSAWEYLELVDREYWSSDVEPLFTVWPLDPRADHIVEPEDEI